MPREQDKILARALAATKAFYGSQAATGTDSEETEGWRDTCDDLFSQLDKKQQKQVKALERKMKSALSRHKPACKDPPPTDDLYRKVRVEFQDGKVNTFIARYDVKEKWWLDQEGALVWPTNWDAEPL